LTKKINWGIIGLGKIANKFAKDLALVEDAELTAVASRSLEKAKTFAEAHQVESYYDNYQSLFDNPDIDIVYIATPHNSHMEFSIQVMNAGKHVLCEKPLAVNKNQVQQMIEASKRNQVFLMEAFWTRFNPSMVSILEKIESGMIGQVNYINADFCFYKDAPAESRMYNMELAGGSLLDVGVYPIFLAYQIYGYPKEILASARFHETGADLQTSIILTHENGMASLFSGFDSQSDMVAKIYGRNGSIMMDDPWHHTDGYNIIKDGTSERFDLPLKGMGFSYEIEECHKCLLNGEIQSQLWSHQNSLDLIRITDEIRSQIGLKYPFE